MSSYQIFTKNIGIIGAANVFIAAERIILLPILTKFLGAANYGIWTQLSITLSLMAPLILLGLPYTLVRFLAGEKDIEQIQDGVYSVLAFVFIIAIVFILLFWFFAQSIADFLQSPVLFVKILGFVILFECLGLVLLGALQAFQEVVKYSLVTILKALGEVGLVLAAIFLGYGLFGAVLSLLIIRLLVFFFLLAYFLKKIEIKAPKFFKIKEYLRFGLPTVASSISYWMVSSSDKYLIGFFLGVLFVGYYAPAYTMASVLTFIIYPFIFMLPPVLSRAFDEHRIETVRTYLKYSLKYFLVIAIPIIFGLSILSQEILTIFSTQDIARNSHHIMPFVALSFLFYGVYNIFVQVLVLFKKTKIFGAIWLGAAFLNIGLNFLFIPIFGIIAAALTTLIAYSFSLGLTWYFASKRLQFEIDWQFIAKSLLASGVMIVCILWLGPVGLFQVSLAILFGATIYGILIYLLRGFQQKEIEFIKLFLKNL